MIRKTTPLRLKLLSGDATAAGKRGFNLRPRRVCPYACVYVQAAASKLQEAFGGQPMPDSSGGIGRRVPAGGPSPCALRYTTRRLKAVPVATAEPESMAGGAKGGWEWERRRRRAARDGTGRGASAKAMAGGFGGGGRRAVGRGF